MTKKEDELSIDFSKIGRKISSLMAKLKTEEKEKSHKSRHVSEKHSAHEHPSHESRDEEEISIDIRKIGSSIIKHKTLFLLLIPLFLAVFFRAYPIYLPVTDDWAENSVQRYYKDQIMQQVNQQYPNLPPENKDSIVNENLQKVIAEQKQMYNQQITEVSQNFKSHFQDDAGQTYLLAIDPWQWYRYSGDIIDHGYPGDYIRENGKKWDKHMIAPLGNRVGDELHPYFGAWLYSILNFFNRDISLLTAFFLLPLIVASLAVIPAFFIGKKIGGNLGGLFASVLVAVHPAILTRTAAGFSDTDAYNVLFPLIIFWLFFEALDSENRKNTIIYSILAGVVVTIFSMTWYGWWYIFDFIVIAIVIYLVYLFVLRKESLSDLLDVRKESKKNLVFIALACFFLSSLIFITLFTDTSGFSAIYKQPLNFITIKQSAAPTLWPNVFTTVAELNEASLNQIIRQLGGKMMFAISLLGILLTITLKKDGKIDVRYAILLLVWYAGTMYASTKGIRFTTLMVPAFAIAIGAAAGISFKYLSKWAVRELHINKIIANVVLAVVLLALLVGPVKSADATVRGEVPSMNDAWYSALTKINTDSTEDAIINSWWDFGHWFKAVADRAVTFDGASQNRPQAHWIGRVLLTSNEKEAVGILRMLDCGANTAFEIVRNETKNIIKSVNIIYDVIVVNEEEAREILEKEISSEAADRVLIVTHCMPPEDYFITSGDMVGKAGVWSHFGSWNFERALIWRDLRKKDVNEAVDYMVKAFGYTEEKAQNLYYETQSFTSERQANNWISPWPGFVGTTSCPKVNNNTIQCVFRLNNQVIPVQVDVESMEAEIETTTGKLYPSSITYAQDDGFVEKKYENNTLPYSLSLVRQGENYIGVMMSPQLAASMFTRLFYHNGVGLEHFDKFDHKNDMTGLNIITWKLDWDGKE